MNEKFGTKKHGTESFKNHNNGKKFFFHFMIILLNVQLFGPMNNRVVELDKDGTRLIIGGISVEVKWYVMVGVCHKNIHNQDCFQVFEGLIHFGDPTKGFLPDLSERGFSM